MIAHSRLSTFKSEYFNQFDGYVTATIWVVTATVLYALGDMHVSW